MTTEASAVDFPLIALRVIGALCFTVYFEGPDAERQACSFIDRKVAQAGGGVQFFTPVRVAEQYTEVWERMSCEHGMTYSLCEGPQHYAYDEEERDFYGV